jgi:hypothetical protein
LVTGIYNMASIAENYEFDLVNEFGGYVSSRDKTNLAAQNLIRGSKNVYKSTNGNIKNRCGKKLRGVVDATEDGVVSSFEWKTSLGFERVLRVLQSGKLHVESTLADGLTIVEYDLITGLSETALVFDSWWDPTEKKDRLLMAVGDSTMRHWSGGIARVASGTVDTITKSDTTKSWAQEGFATNTAGEKKLKINGVEYTYTGGESGSTLTGVTPDASALVDGLVAVQSVISETSKPDATFELDFLKVIGNRVHCGSYTSRLVYISDDTSFLDYTVTSPRAPGDPELLTLDSAPTGIGVREGMAHISAGTFDWYIVQYENIVDSTGAVTQQTKVDKKEISVLGAALRHEFIVSTGDDIIYLSQDQQLRVYGTFANLQQPKFPTLSQAVKDELMQENFTGGHLRAIGDYLYLTAPINGRMWIHETRESIDSNGNVIADRLWNPPFIVDVSRVAVISGVVYGYSNANPQMYQLWDTDQWHDDGPSGEEIPYECVLRMAYRSHGRRQGRIRFDKLYTEGYMTEGTPLNAYVYCDYQGATALQSIVINSTERPAKFFSGVGVATIGMRAIGDLPLGDGIIPEGGEQELVPKFRNINALGIVNCFEYDIAIFSSETSARWEIIALGVNPVQAPEQPVFLSKVNN